MRIAGSGLQQEGAVVRRRRSPTRFTVRREGVRGHNRLDDTDTDTHDVYARRVKSDLTQAALLAEHVHEQVQGDQRVEE